MRRWMMLGIGLSLMGSELYYFNGGRRIDLVPLAGEARAATSAKPWRCLDPKGREVVVTTRLLVKFRTLDRAEASVQKYALRRVAVYGDGRLWLLEADSPQAALEAANALYRQEDVVWAQPDLGRRRGLR